MEIKKWVRRHLPCHPYDVEGIESWLADMARRGYILQKQPMFLGGLYFEKDEPADISYRLEASPEGEGDFNCSDEPENLAKELNEKYGWEFVVKCGAFFIYRSLKPNTRELNTDPTVQAYSLNILIKKKMLSLIPYTAWMIFPAIELAKRGLPVLIDNNPWIIFGLLFLFSIISFSDQIRRIRKLQNTLKKNGTLNHRKKVRNLSLVYATEKYLPVLLFILAVIITFIPPKYFRSADTGEVPFATIEECLYNEKSGHSIEVKKTVDTDYGFWRNIIAPENVNWYECVTAEDGGGNTFTCMMFADCHKLINDSLALKTAEDYYRYDNRKNDTQKIELSGVTADYSAAYKTSLNQTKLIIQKGNTVIYAAVSRGNSEDDAYVNSWAKTIAESIK